MKFLSEGKVKRMKELADELLDWTLDPKFWEIKNDNGQSVEKTGVKYVANTEPDKLPDIVDFRIKENEKGMVFVQFVFDITEENEND